MGSAKVGSVFIYGCSRPTHHFLIFRIFPECQGVSLQDNPAAVPGPKPRDIVKHGQESTVGHLHVMFVLLRSKKRGHFIALHKKIKVLPFYLTLAMTVQLESYVPIERRNVGNSLQTPLLLGQTVDGDQSVAHLQM